MLLHHLAVVLAAVGSEIFPKMPVHAGGCFTDELPGRRNPDSGIDMDGVAELRVPRRDMDRRHAVVTAAEKPEDTGGLVGRNRAVDHLHGSHDALRLADFVDRLLVGLHAFGVVGGLLDVKG